MEDQFDLIFIPFNSSTEIDDMEAQSAAQKEKALLEKDFSKFQSLN
jgi:hypothetical protein